MILAGSSVFSFMTFNDCRRISVYGGWLEYARRYPWSFVFNDLLLETGLYIGLQMEEAITLTFCTVDAGAVPGFCIRAYSLDIIVGKKSRFDMTYYQTTSLEHSILLSSPERDSLSSYSMDGWARASRCGETHHILINFGT